MAMPQRRVVGPEGELGDVLLVGADSVPLVDRRFARSALDPLVPGREAERGEVAVVTEPGDRPEHLVARHAIDLFGHRAHLLVDRGRYPELRLRSPATPRSRLRRWRRC